MVPYKYQLIWSLQPCKVGIIGSFIQMRNLRLQEDKLFAKVLQVLSGKVGFKPSSNSKAYCLWSHMPDYTGL